jgi:hypothetical protein
MICVLSVVNSKNCSLLWFFPGCRAECKGKITSNTDGMKAEIDARKTAVEGNAKDKGYHDKMRSEMEQLKMLLADIKTEAAKSSASQPARTFTNVASTSPVSGGKAQNGEIGNKERSPIAPAGIPSKTRPLLPSVIGTDAPPPQSCKVGEPGQLKRKVGRV